MKKLNYMEQLSIDEILIFILDRKNKENQREIEKAILVLKRRLNSENYTPHKYEKRFVELFVNICDKSDRVKKALWIFLKHWFKIIVNETSLTFLLNSILTYLQTSFKHQESNNQLSSIFFLQMVFISRIKS